jgi:hypothetical protein
MDIQALDAAYPPLNPGDVLAFVRPTLRQAWRAHRWQGLKGWVSGLLIATGQIGSGGAQDGFYELSHVGVVIHALAGLALLESVPGGVRIVPLAKRVAEYPGVVLHMPLAERYRAKFDRKYVDRWYARHAHDEYRGGGLLFPCAWIMVGSAKPGKLFCSELVANLFGFLGIVPRTLPVLCGGYVTEMRLEPQLYSPCEIARLPQLARAQYNILGGSNEPVRVA